MNKTYYKAKENNNITDLELKNRKVAYNAAVEGIVLLKNQDNVLPLKENNIALYGIGALYTIKGGTGSGEVNERYNVTIYDGLLNHKFRVTNNSYISEYIDVYSKAYKKYMSKGLNIFNLKAEFSKYFNPPLPRSITESDKIESKTDTAIYVVSRQAGEGKDKRLGNGDFELKEKEIEDIKMMSSLYKNSILVINSGSYMDLKDTSDYVKAIIYFSEQGEEGGNAFAELVKGNENFSAKLTDTWAYNYHDILNSDNFSYLNNDTKNEYYNEGIFVGYRYFDTYNIKPRYSFGYGLSYTKFEIKANKLVKIKDKFILDLDVINTGNYKGKEVVEVYISLPNGKLLKESRRLVGYNKTKLLNINEKENIVISFNAYSFSSFNEELNSYVLEKGLYTIYYGNSLDNLKPYKNICLNEDLILSKHESIIKRDDRLKEIVIDSRKDYTVEGLEQAQLNKEDINYIEHKYEEVQGSSREDVKNILDKLDTSELIDLVVGAGGTASIMTSGIYAPGAVGRTTDKLFNKGLINLNLSDGPAGLRLLKESGLTKNNKFRFIRGSYPINFLERLNKIFLKPFEAKKNDKILYQYLTAFPVATSLAQSFNLELIEEVGNAISKEMNETNVSFFLSPALNIHRNPLCGRNFEYYSEDPLVSGLTASSIVKGIEKEKGNYATIKHFACNNQEDNRNKSNSILSERTLREIYLKGFEICIKESNPRSVMSSYNLVNSIYTPNSEGLLIKALRNEWGFKGLVMTDWFSTNKGLGRNDLAIKYSNDLIMPGTKHAKKEIKRGLKKNIINENDLRRSASLIIEAILDSKVFKEYKDIIV